MDTEKNSPNGVIFVHADLDLYGLSPYEFRLYAHVARRGECFSSLETIANICKMSVRKAQYGLKSLEKQGLIKKKIRKGRTDVYELTSRVEWKEPEYANKLQTEREKVKASLLKSEISTEIQSQTNEDDIEF
ncbi:MAG: helix-turn-helix domain-containing protein [Dolichospermum sp.]|jgi:DNA-binding MarR family transcriptional regulator|nr:helix-turn-helix domain-containing protein [Anabaena sp. 49628_E55]